MQNLEEFLLENYEITKEQFEELEEKDPYQQRIIELEWNAYIDHYLK